MCDPAAISQIFISLGEYLHHLTLSYCRRIWADVFWVECHLFRLSINTLKCACLNLDQLLARNKLTNNALLRCINLTWWREL